MRYRFRFTCLTVAIALLASLRIVGAQPQLPMVTAPVAPPGYLFVDEEMWSQLVDEAGRHLDRAREGFLHGHSRTAVAELRKAAIMMRIDAAHGQDRADLALIKSAHELEQLALRLSSPQSIDNLDDLDAVSSRALTALADHQQLKADLAWKHRHFRRSGHYLRASADNLERVSFRARATVSIATATAIKDARIISGGLIEGTGVAVDEVGAGIAALGHQIKHIGHTIVRPFVEGR